MKKLTLLLLGCFAGPAVAQPPLPDKVQFNRDVRPILADNCFACHGPDANKRKGKLRLDTEAGLQAARASGVLVNGSPAQSTLHQRVVAKDRKVMPPPKTRKSLTPRQIALLARWIEQGAPWEPHWAFIAPKRVAPPAGDQASPIDRFVDARLRTAGLAPVGAADRATLIRRLSLDLIGLPPTPAEVDAFVKDRSPEAYEKAVERLLASPHFGERLALSWLDLVRYADSVGYHKDTHQDVWLYRDYVIRAFNDNKRFDRFVIEQLAGDLLEGNKFEKFEWQVASGFNRMNQTTSEGGAQAKEYLAKYAADRVRNTGSIFLGLTTGCAECHDHKFDPFTTKDFYSFAAFFGDLQERGVGQPKQVPIPTRAQRKHWQELEQELARQTQALERARGADEPDAASIDSLTEKTKELATKIKQISNPKSWPTTLITQSGRVRTVRILPRGNWLDDSGPLVQPAVPESMGKLAVDKRASRLDLARWIVKRDNPLTARVFVNRLWKLYYGAGLCRTLDDLGRQGQLPSHPELLDWLAVEFMESGWNVKHMVKLMVMTDAYRRGSSPGAELLKRDPDNIYLARQASFRLEAELVRDNALAISGLLSRKLGGRSVKPYQPANYWFRLYANGKYVQDHGADLYRRGLYTYWRRSFWHPSLRAFDAPAREECVAERPRSNTPQQSLVLLNDPTYVEAARAFAENICQQGPSTGDRLDWAYRRALARKPTDQEKAVLTDLVRKQERRFAEAPDAARKLLSTGERPLPAQAKLSELAAWTSVARVILNLHETVTRN